MTSTTTPEEQSGNQSGGVWFKLPAELRLEIYELMFPQETVSIVAVRDHLEREAKAHCSAGDCVAILATCRAIHDEAKPVLYANTRFEVSCSLGFTVASRKSVSIQQARNIDLNIELSRSLVSWESSLDQLPTTLSGFANLQTMHIKLWTRRYPRTSVQRQADHVFSLLPKIRNQNNRRLPITAAMDPSLGGTGFSRARYHTVIRRLGVPDRTQQKYMEMQTALSDGHTSIQRDLAVLSARLVVKLRELTEIKKDECWSVRPASKARADQLAGEMQSITDDIFKLHEKTDSTKGKMESLRYQLQLLMNGP